MREAFAHRADRFRATRFPTCVPDRHPAAPLLLRKDGFPGLPVFLFRLLQVAETRADWKGCLLRRCRRVRSPWRGRHGRSRSRRARA